MGSQSPTIITKSNKDIDGWTLQLYCGQTQVLFEASNYGTHIGDCSGVDLTANQWYFVTMSYDHSTQEFKGYMNGEPKTSRNDYQIGQALTRFLTIGHGYNTAGNLGTAGFQGSIDDIRIYNRALSDQEILNLYHENGWPLNQELVAYYPFSGNANDESGNGNNGTVYGATLVTDRFGNNESAFHFNGSTDSISCGNNASLQSIDFTVACWIKPDIIPMGSQSPTIITKSNKDIDGWTLQLYCGQTQVLFEASNYGTHIGDCSGVDLTASQWYFVTMSYDHSTQEFKGYINGELKTSRNDYQIGQALTRFLTIGHGYNTTGNLGTAGFQGSIDDIRIYNRALSDQEILSLYNLTTDLENEIRNISINDYQLIQNYPNPFNPSTKISWHSAISGKQSLKVYDILGKEVATLVNEYRDAGDYNINFDASHLPSGIYIYQIQIGNFVQTKKMILLK